MIEEANTNDAGGSLRLQHAAISEAGASTGDTHRVSASAEKLGMKYPSKGISKATS